MEADPFLHLVLIVHNLPSSGISTSNEPEFQVLFECMVLIHENLLNSTSTSTL